MIKVKEALDLYNKMYGTDYKNVNELGIALARTALKDLYLATKMQETKTAHEAEELESLE